MKIVELSEIKDFENIKGRVCGKFIREDGVLVSYRNTRGNMTEQPKILKGVNNADGYVRDDFFCKKTKTGFKLFRHQLVACAFLGYRLGDYAKGIEIDHADRNRKNNHVSNLCLSDRRGNVDNSVKAKITNRLFSREDILKIYKMRFIDKFSFRAIGALFGVSGHSIMLICYGKTYKEIHDKEITNFI